MRKCSHPKVATLDVSELVKESHPKGLWRPVGRIFRKVDTWANQPGNNWRSEAWMNAQINTPGDIKFAQGFLKNRKIIDES